MKQHKHKGFTLVEVLTGFVMLSFIVVMVTTVMTSGFMLSARIHELPNAYYGAQDKAEKEIDKISALVKKKFRLMSELGPLPINFEEADPDLVTEYFEVQENLGEYTMDTIDLFGKSVEVYKEDVDFASRDNKVFVTLHIGVVNAEKLERQVPIIDTVTIKPTTNGSAAQDFYFSDGLEIGSSVVYDSRNYNQRFKELYQWYIGTGGFHTAEYSNGMDPEHDTRYGKLYTQYPSYYTPLAGETRSTITLKEEYYGQLLVCVVTPLSKNGAMGESVVSNALYISALPTLSEGEYRMLIDVSMHPFTFTDDSEVTIDSMPSRHIYNTKLTSGNTRPKVNMDGTPTDTNKSTAPAAEGTWTRFISFTGSTYMTSSHGWDDAQAFVVVRKTDNAGLRDVDFIGNVSTGRLTAGFLSNEEHTDGSGDTGWRLLQVDLPSSRFFIGKAQVEVAELIVVEDPSDSDEEKIWEYLLQKYRIEDN